MKAILVAAAVTLAACGGTGSNPNDNQPPPCAGPTSGVWHGDSGDMLDLTDTCAFSYRGADGCQSTGSYSQVLGTSGTMLISITTATGGNCLPAGSYRCAYALSGGQMAYDCGAGAFTYHR